MIPKKIPIDTKTSYIVKNLQTLKDLWIRGKSYESISELIQEETGLRITKQMLNYVLKKFVSQDDRIHRVINTNKKPNQPVHEKS